MSKEYTYIPKKRVCHKLMIHPLLVVGKARICSWKRQDMLLRQLVSPVAQQLLCACITADMRMHNR